jgi:hypothetical protein
MADLAAMLIERITALERRLKDLERREYTSGGASSSSLTVEEEDGAPSVSGVSKIQAPNGTLTNDGGGTVSLGYAPSAQGVTNGNSHDHAGGDGAQVDHGGLGGLADDDHTQYLLANGTRGLSADWDAGSHEIRAQTLEADVATGTAPLTIASTTVVTNLNADQLDGNHAAAFATAAQGVTNGDSHDHAGGDGAQIDHGGLGGLSDEDHPQYLSYPCQGRLTLESGAPISTTDQAAKTTLYFTPYKGNKISLYDGSAAWATLTFTELSITLAGLTASRPYDVFCYNNGGTATLELLAWTNATTRATALTTQNGVWVKSGATTRRYLGTIYINSSGGQTDDTITKRFVWNYYNRAQRYLYTGDSTSHTYNGAARKWNNSDTNNKLEFIAGLAENAVSITIKGAQYAGADGSYAIISPYLDGSEINAFYRIDNYNAYRISTALNFFQTEALGYHYMQAYELGNHASSTFAHFLLTINSWM